MATRTVVPFGPQHPVLPEPIRLPRLSATAIEA